VAQEAQAREWAHPFDPLPTEPFPGLPLPPKVFKHKQIKSKH
jgi:hypothetical protein